MKLSHEFRPINWRHFAKTCDWTLPGKMFWVLCIHKQVLSNRAKESSRIGWQTAESIEEVCLPLQSSHCYGAFIPTQYTTLVSRNSYCFISSPFLPECSEKSRLRLRSRKAFASSHAQSNHSGPNSLEIRRLGWVFLFAAGQPRFIQQVG